MGGTLLPTAAALLFCSLWAMAFVAAKVGMREVPPLTLLVLRFGLAGLALLPIAVWRGSAFPRGRVWLPVVGLGLLTNAIYLGLSFYGLLGTSAGSAAVINCTNPLLTAALAPLAIGERPGRQTLLGLAIGFLGVVGVMLPRVDAGADTPLGAGVMTVAVLSMVFSTLLFKRIPRGPGLLAVTACQLLSASLALVLPALLLEPVHTARLGPDTLRALLFLSLGVSVGGSLIWFWLLGRGEATRVAAWFFLTPVLGLGLGALLLGEPIGLRELPGLLAVTAGIVLVNRKQ